ncbi:hypothetical protein Tco_0292033 [Tanacetum coccineum]
MGSNEEIRRLAQEAEKQQLFAQKVQQQNTNLTSQLEMYKERVRILEGINKDNNYLNEFLEADERAKRYNPNKLWFLVYQTYCEWEMMVSGLDANVSSVADVRKGRVGSVHYGSENIQVCEQPLPEKVASFAQDTIRCVLIGQRNSTADCKCQLLTVPEAFKCLEMKIFLFCGPPVVTMELPYMSVERRGLTASGAINSYRGRVVTNRDGTTVPISTVFGRLRDMLTRNSCSNFAPRTGESPICRPPPVTTRLPYMFVESLGRVVTRADRTTVPISTVFGRFKDMPVSSAEADFTSHTVAFLPECVSAAMKMSDDVPFGIGGPMWQGFWWFQERGYI